MLERAKIVRRAQLSKSSVHRLLSRHGASARPGRGGTTGLKPRLAWICEFAGDLWVGDAKHGPLVIAADGRVSHSKVVGVIDLLRQEKITKFAINVQPTELSK